ncbi:MAG TPA: N-acetylmuramoyl-L-alanine amidase-like domain-containing protein [Longimicrobiales bacterium]|nr:N-acetylmuramoyl-L-alanine amidase-like domain-containing protein [Longimicrobiales bacterium]
MRTSDRSDVRHVRVLFAACAVALTACSGAEEQAESVERTGEEAAAVTPAFDVTEQPADSIAFEETIAWARANQVDTLPIGEAIAALGRTFVGTPYIPQTLELEGDERLIVNLRELDCVTFIENMLAIARVLRAGTPDYDSFKRELVRIRYRDGVLSGYASRLHYFSEWIADNEEKGIVDDVTLAIGGVPDTGGISFMTRNAEAYRQLSDPSVVDEIRTIETTLTGRERHFIPQDAIEPIAQNIRNGDIIAATSTLEGLDVAHTGYALWVDGRLHLMHAPLIGSVVEISELPLADRLQRIDAQDGIMVARPL